MTITICGVRMRNFSAGRLFAAAVLSAVLVMSAQLAGPNRACSQRRGGCPFRKRRLDIRFRSALCGPAGQEMRTGKGSGALLTFSDGSKIILNRNSQFRIDKTDNQAAAPPARPGLSPPARKPGAGTPGAIRWRNQERSKTRPFSICPFTLSHARISGGVRALTGLCSRMRQALPPFFSLLGLMPRLVELDNALARLGDAGLGRRRIPRLAGFHLVVTGEQKWFGLRGTFSR